MTPQQMEALSEIEACMPAPHFVPVRSTAVALVNRRWIEPVTAGQQLDAKTLYRLTVAGSTALRIERRQRERENARSGSSQAKPAGKVDGRYRQRADADAAAH